MREFSTYSQPWEPKVDVPLAKKQTPKPLKPTRARFFTLQPYRLTPFQASLWFCFAWLLLLATWEITVSMGWINARILPPPSQTLPYLWSGQAGVGFGAQKTYLWHSLAFTLARVTLGLLLGISAAL